MQIARYSSETDRTPANEELSWEELVKVLTKHRRTPCTPCRGKECEHKSGPAWGPYAIDNCPDKCHRHGQRSDCGGGRAHRLNENVRATTLAVFDLDHVTLQAGQEVLEKVSAAGLSCVAHSSHSHREDDACLRLVFPLSRPLRNEERLAFRAAVEGTFGFRADPATKDASRLYFLPSAAERVPVIVWSSTGVALDVDAHLGRPGTTPALAQAEGVAPLLVGSSPVDLEEIRRRLRNLRKPASRALAEKILLGERLAELGERNVALNRACSLLVAVARADTPTEALLELLRPSLAQMPPGYNGEPWPMEAWLREAAEMIERARPRRAEWAASRARWNRAVREGLGAEPTHSETGEDDLGDALNLEDDEASGEPYTKEQIEQWAREQGTTVDGFEERWIIQRNKAYYLFVAGNYKRAIPREDLAVSMRRDLARAPISLTTADRNGDEKPLGPQAVLMRYATAARENEASLILQRSYYDARTETFHEAVRPLRSIQAKDHPEIQEWLELLGGDERDRLLDWVATVARLDRQTCAIFLHGDAGIGKTLFARGLARLWSTSGPAELERVLSGSFNDSLLNCPLIFGDESIPYRKGVTSELRRLIGSSGRTLSRKFLPTCNLVGAVRLILAGNNDRLLVPDEDLSAEDLEAVAGRFLYIRPDRKTKAFLDGLGGPPVLDRWITHDYLAEHAHFLAATRTVDESRRFLVEGKMRSFHDHLAVGSGLGGLVCEWLARHLGDRITGSPSSPTAYLVLAGHGQVWVNAEALVRKTEWEKRVPSAPVPSAARVSRVLTNLSSGSERARIGDKQYRYHKIRTRLLLTWAEANMTIDLDALRERIEGSNPIIERSLGRLPV